MKSLLLYVQAAYGPADADAFLLKTRLDRDYLEDETRPLPLEVWHAALVEFASRWGRQEIGQTVSGIVHTDNLGVWTRVLRGTTNPSEAFRQLDQYGGDDVLTERWATVTAGAGLWRGRIRLRGDPSHERDGLCALARATELSAVPLLFGLEQGQVRMLHSEPDHSGAAIQEFEVQWRAQGTAPIWIGGAIGALSGAGAGFGWSLPLDAALPLALAVTVTGAVGGHLIAHDSKRRMQTRAQLFRIQALERAAALRDTRERGATGFHEGTVIAGQYRLGQKLGVGASGTIWEAERLSDGTVVAIKLLRAAVAHDTVAADRLRREAAALGLAWHPNVVEVYDDGHLPDGTSYLVMERLYGESLGARLRRVGALSLSDLLPIALQVCDALGAVHAAGVVHRDLKPSNIFLSQGDSDLDDDPAHQSLSKLPTRERVKLLDFGVARVEWAETRLTNMDGPLGTPGYMSPEQEQGGEIDQRTDLFALGGVIYECLTGYAPPLRTSDLWEIQRGLAGESAESGVQKSASGIPDAWCRVIERAMAPLPRDRFSDARSMRDALVALAGLEEQAVPSSQKSVH